MYGFFQCIFQYIKPCGQLSRYFFLSNKTVQGFNEFSITATFIQLVGNLRIIFSLFQAIQV